MHFLEVKSGLLFDLGLEFSSEEDILNMNVMVSTKEIYLVACLSTMPHIVKEQASCTVDDIFTMLTFCFSH